MSHAAAGYLDERPNRDGARGGPIRPFGDVLGDLAGRRVLEYGCGNGELTIRLAKSGARVSTFDLSYSSVAETRRLAEAHGVYIEAVEAAAERLPYADETFDLVVGRDVLRLLDVERAGRELRRILKPGSRAVFVEPLRAVDVEAWGKGFSGFGRREISRVPFLRRQALIWMVK